MQALYADLTVDTVRNRMVQNGIKMIRDRNYLFTGDTPNLDKEVILLSDNKYFGIVFNFGVGTVDKKLIERLSKMMAKLLNDGGRFVIVADKEMTKNVYKYRTKTMELMTFGELRIYPLENILVPKHILLSQEDAKALLTGSTYEKHRLKKMRDTDPIMRWLGARSGQIVAVIEQDETGIEISYYLVIPGF